jgi:glycosyltransferase involved in cell wall biosynthesis
MLEAASIGKMHIGTKVGGIPEFIEDGITGKLIEPGNTEQLAQTISFLLDNPIEYKRMGSNAKNKYEKYFGLDRMINETISAYDSVLNKNNYIGSEKDCK